MKITESIADALVEEFLTKNTHEMTLEEKIDFIEKIQAQLKIQFLVFWLEKAKRTREAIKG